MSLVSPASQVDGSYFRSVPADKKLVMPSEKDLAETSDDTVAPEMVSNTINSSDQVVISAQQEAPTQEQRRHEYPGGVVTYK